MDGSKLFILGGKGPSNVLVDTVYVYDTNTPSTPPQLIGSLHSGIQQPKRILLNVSYIYMFADMSFLHACEIHQHSLYGRGILCVGGNNVVSAQTVSFLPLDTPTWQPWISLSPLLNGDAIKNGNGFNLGTGTMVYDKYDGEIYKWNEEIDNFELLGTKVSIGGSGAKSIVVPLKYFEKQCWKDLN